MEDILKEGSFRGYLKLVMFRRIGKFLGEVRSEIKKVSWTKRSELILSTSVVIVIVVLVAAFVGIIDRVLSEIVGFIIEN